MAKEEGKVDGEVGEGEVYPKTEREGVFIRYTVLIIAVILLMVFFIIVIVMVHFLHPGWGCPQQGDGLPIIAAQTRKPFNGRLPDTLKPTNYVIKITPYMDEEDGDKRFLFDGEVNITMNCTKSTNIITLHVLKLNIDENTVKVNEIDTNEDMGVSKISTDEEYDFFIVKTKRKMQSGKQYKISINYVGLLNNSDIVALYLSTYKVGDETRYAVASQLEHVFSRRVFPSFDEPAMKATFDIIIKHRNSRSALSNMPVIRNETDGDWNTAYFDTSPVMSNYLVAIVVADFVYKEKITKSGFKMRVWATRDLINATEFALNFGVETVEYLETMWNISYPLPKLDMVALPVYKFGAMENWGLTVYKDTRMCYDRDVNTPFRAQKAALIISHELVHNWFGNSVTMAWWGESWLNEGFATHFEQFAVDYVKPMWKMFEEFYQDQVTLKSFNADSGSESHATVRPDVGWYTELWEQFDVRIYERGSHMIMMMSSILGDTVFFDGLRNYLMKHKYGNAYSDDLMVVLSQTARNSGIDIDMKDVMDPWLRQIGFPVVTITRRDDTITIQQRVFLRDSEDELPDAPENLDYTWNIPLTYVISSDKILFDNPSLLWMNRTTTETIKVDNVSSYDWILGNIYQHGYYRVNYDLDNWNKLIEQLAMYHKTIPVQNRAALVDDAFNLARSGDVIAVLAFQVSDYLRNEENYSPWKAYVSNIKYVSRLLENTPLYGNLELYSQDLIKPLYDKYDWRFHESDSDDINHIKYHMKVLAIKHACEVNYENCVKEAKSQFSKWKKNQVENEINQDVRQTVFCTAIRHGGQEEWRYLYEELEMTDDYSLKTDIVSGLVCTKNVWLLQRLIDDAYKRSINESSDADKAVPSKFTSEDAPLDFSKVMEKIMERSSVGHMVAEAFIMNNFDDIYERHSDKAFIWKLADGMNTVLQQNRLEDFGRRNNDMPQSQVKKFYKSLRTVKANVRWMERNYVTLEQWLKEKTKDL